MDILVTKDFDKKLEMMKKLKKDFKVRTSKNYSEILMTNGGQKIMFNEGSKFQSGLFLFKAVRKDIEKWIKEKRGLIPEKELPVNHCNPDFPEDERVIGIDLDHAYWRIAFLKGFISKNTYKKGLSEPHYKTIRLSALSSLGKDYTYDVYEHGKYVGTSVHKGDKELRDFYDDIRFSTFKVMKEIAEELGNDFKCWKTDCIVFKETQENIDLVEGILWEYDLLWKIELKSDC